MNIRKSFLTCLIIILICSILCSCSNSSSPSSSTSSTTDEQSGPPRDNTPQVLTPSGNPDTEYSNDFAAIDSANSSQGYIMASYKGNCEKVRIQITTPDATTYTYVLPLGGNYQTFPLSGGDGNYQIQVLENISGDSYAVVLSQEIDVQIENEFLPYLYPNQYVDFTADSKAVAKGADLAEDAYSDLDVVSNIYHYVIENISYDTEKAESVTYGYLPDVDETLASGTGICFDYASLMSCMLRSQGIPTKLEVGYSGEALHSWISTYIDDIGWVDNIIEFDGSSWQLMDPTLAANNDSSSVGKYIGDGNNYTLKYTY